MSAPFPRVTEIITAVGLGPDFSAVPAATLAAAQVRGTAVHAGIEALVYGYDHPALEDPALAGYFDAYRKFLAESGFEPKAAEIEVVHEAWRYCGHPDVWGWLLGHRALLDFKTGEDEGVEYQLAGYRLAWNHQRPTETIDVLGRVRLNSDGTFQFREVETAAAEQVFLAAVVVYHAQKERRR